MVGSILGMNGKMLIQGFTRMFVPLIVGTASSIIVGIGVGFYSVMMSCTLFLHHRTYHWRWHW